MPRSPTSRRIQSDMKPEKAVPAVAFRVLDAPRLKDDFYCSVLAYSYTCRTLAVALTHRVYLWTEANGVRYPPLPPNRAANYVSALAFSSSLGGKAILAVARNSGHITLWSLFEQKPRFELPHPWAACSVSWRPKPAYRPMPDQPEVVPCEDLLVGDDSGAIYYYSIYWPDYAAGQAVLLAKLDAHSQNICGLAWSPDGKTFVSGGNDNAALLFYVDDIIRQASAAIKRRLAASDDTCKSITGEMLGQAHALSPHVFATEPRGRSPPSVSGEHDIREFVGQADSLMATAGILTPEQSPEREAGRGRTSVRSPRMFESGRKVSPRSWPYLQQNLENHLANPGIEGQISMHKRSFYHSAAVKAIAFAPWQPTLLATGGGSNDRQIHFHHTESGSALAVINVYAQVTSLAWSLTKREVVATFGYAHPEHDVRIAVFAWPSCECVISIPWERKPNGEIGRALWAIPYPGGPNDAVLDKQDNDEVDIGFQAWEALQASRASGSNRTGLNQRISSVTTRNNPWSPRSAGNVNSIERGSRSNRAGRAEGEIWASRTEEEGSLIIACCDQTVKFFEIWAGKSKGRSRGIGAKAGVLGGSKVLEGWCHGVSVDEVGENETIR